MKSELHGILYIRLTQLALKFVCFYRIRLSREKWIRNILKFC